MHEKLREVLEAYVWFRPDIGYVQGMSYLAAVLLLYMDSFPAFVCLANILNSHCLMTFYRMDIKTMHLYIEVLDEMRDSQLHDLHVHLKSLDISTDLFIVDWLLTLFSKALPLDIAGHIWDVYLYEGDFFLFRCVIGLLSVHSNELTKSSFEECLTLLTHIPDSLNEKELFVKTANVKISKEKFNLALQSRGLPTV